MNVGLRAICGLAALVSCADNATVRAPDGASDTGAGADLGQGLVAGSWLPTSQAQAPAPRRKHAAVWTGAEMVVWGGVTEDGTKSLGDGGRYDARADAWRPVGGPSSAGQLFTLIEPMAVWTGSEMVLGMGALQGADPGETAPARAAFDPAADSWRLIATGPPLLARSTMVWSGTEAIVWGGLDSAGTGPSNAGSRFQPAKDQWTPISSVNAPSRRASHVAVWTGSEMIVWGGVGPMGPLADGGRYDPALDAWKPIAGAGAPTPVESGASAVWTGSELIVWGGYVNNRFLDGGGRYDPATDSWRPLGSDGAPAPRAQHTAIWTGSEMIVYGGQGANAAGACCSLFRDGARYQPASDRWVPLPTENAPPGDNGHSAVWTGDEMIVWGGEDGKSAFASGGSYRTK